MDKQRIINYVLESPHNTNPAILNQFIDTYVAEHGGGGSSSMTIEDDYLVISASIDNNDILII